MSSKILRLLTFLLLHQFLLALVPDAPRPYGTKTAYDFSFAADELTARDSGNLPVPSVCTPIYVAGLFKHGMKYPSSGTVKWTGRLLDRIAGNIQAADFSGLNSRQMQFTDDTASELSPAGEMEMKEIGQGFANRYSSLLDGASEQEVAFYSSSTDRATSSAEAFRERFSEILNKFSSIEIEESDVAQFEDECKKFIDDVRENDATYAEQDAFNEGPEMTQLAETMTDRLDLNGTDLTSSDLLSLYQLTAYEEAILGDSPWSDIWTSRDEYILEYQDDVELYWAENYGQPITREMSCVVMEKLFEEMDAAKAAKDAGNSSYHKGTFVFGDVKVMLSPASLMGLFRGDRELRANNYAQNQDRKFRSGIVAPQGANLAFALYECDEGAHGESPDVDGGTWPQNLDKYMIQVFHKEIAVQVPGTCGFHLCSFDDVRDRFSEYIDECDFTERCKPDASMATVAKASCWLFSLLMIVYVFM